MDLPTKAISVRQPWAWAIMFAGKDIENRSWQAVRNGLNVRGPIMLHAAKGMTRYEYEDASAFMSSIGVECPPACDLWRGCVLGTVEVVDIVKESTSPWFFGPRGLVLRNPKSCTPVPIIGSLGAFEWDTPERRNTDFAEVLPWMRPKASKPEPQGSLI